VDGHRKNDIYYVIASNTSIYMLLIKGKANNNNILFTSFYFYFFFHSYEGSAVSQFIQTDDALPEKFDSPILVKAEIYNISLKWNLPIINGQPIGNGQPLIKYEIQQMQWSVDKYARSDEDNTNNNVKKWITLDYEYPSLTDKDGIQPLPAYGPTFISKGLKPGIEYKYRVRGMNRVGWSPWTDESLPMLTLSDTPDIPTAPVALDSTRCEVDIAWMTPISNGPPVTAYEVQQMRLNCDVSIFSGF
jgi:hypothetical protein